MDRDSEGRERRAVNLPRECWDWLERTAGRDGTMRSDLLEGLVLLAMDAEEMRARSRAGSGEQRRGRALAGFLVAEVGRIAATEHDLLDTTPTIDLLRAAALALGFDPPPCQPGNAVELCFAERAGDCPIHGPAPSPVQELPGAAPAGGVTSAAEMEHIAETGP